MLETSQNLWLMFASLGIALMASFTGLCLTQGASGLSLTKRKATVAMAAVALGGGIWSMHFVAMLGLQLPILFYYDTLITLASAFIAILIVGLALLVLHFRERTRLNITLAGVIVGLGIPAMHYVGMSGMQLCRAVYTPMGLAVAIAASVVLSVGAIWIAYGRRTHRNIILGTICFGGAVVLVHFVAMFGTRFFPTESDAVAGVIISNESLAIMVLLISFLICSAFLLSGVTFLPASLIGRGGTVEPPAQPAQPAAPQVEPTTDKAASGQVAAQVPYEKDGRTLFADRATIAAVRAEGHYTVLYVGNKKLFCPWSISEAEARLPPPYFVRAHRSYLINPALVSSFERHKDNGICFFETTESLGKVTVSRSRLPFVREALGL